MRGAHNRSAHRIQEVRIIPAYAGSTHRACGHNPPLWDHPRVCGEHPSSLRAQSSLVGSSPRMRGAQISILRTMRLSRIIPAYAGSTEPAHGTGARQEDHPRVCGEHTAEKVTASEALGSSPRMRGARASSRLICLVIRIIPAYAGSTDWPSWWRSIVRDHPRVCGEHRAQRGFVGRQRGSSPRMRGAPRDRTSTALCAGIIPAYAGSTTAHRTNQHIHKDHPRVCGEHLLVIVPGCDSPGIIPAYAGSTMSEMSRKANSGDHPRVCGEHSLTTSLSPSD